MGLDFYETGLQVAKLPHPPISTSIFLVVENALCVVWSLLRTHPRPGFDLLQATEDEITHELYERLNDEIYDKGVVDGFNRYLFTVVVREAKVRNYDRTHLDKMPDLMLGLSDRTNVFKRSQDYLFIECKPVDSSHSIGANYCGRGIIRFVRGEYAWTMTEALMVGYVRQDYTISSNLVYSLKRQKEIPTTSFPCPCHVSKPGTHNEAVQVSIHSRTFSYIETGNQAPDIKLRHLWLRRD